MNGTKLSLLLIVGVMMSGCGQTGLLRSDLQFAKESFDSEDQRIQSALKESPTDYNWRLRRAALDYAMGRYESSKRQLNDLAALEKGEPNLYVLQALVLLETGEYEAAVRAVEKGRELQRELPLTELQTRIVGEGLRRYTEDKNWRGGHQLIVVGGEHLPNEGYEEDRALAAKVHLEWGKQERAGGYYRDAIVTLQRCRDLTGHADCEFELGAAYSSIGEGELAQEAFQRYLNEAERPASVLKVGEFLEGNFLFDEALAVYESAGTDHETSEVLTDVVTELRLKRQEPDEARKNAMKGLRGESTKPPEEWLKQAMLFQRYRESEAAAAFIDEAMKLFPGSLPLVDAKARSLLFEGKSGDVERLFDQHLEAYPERGREIGQLIEDLGLVDEARTFYQATASRGGENVDLWVDAARMAYEAGDWKGCNKSLERFISESRGSAESKEKVGLFFLERENTRAAERYLREAHKKAPERDKTALALARLYGESGRQGQESKTIRRFLKSAPDELEARLRAAQYWRESGNADEAETLFADVLSQGGIPRAQEEAALSGQLGLLIDGERLGDVEKLVESYGGQGTLASFAAEEAWRIVRAKNVKPPEKLETLAKLRRAASPQNVEVLVEYAGLMLNLGRLENATEGFSAVIRLSPNPQKIFDSLSQELHEQGNTNVVVALLKSFPELQLPPLVARGVGLLLLEEGPSHNPERGQAYLRAYLDSESLKPDACIETGELLRKQGYLGLAEYTLSRPSCKALEEERLGALGQVKLRQGQKSEALECFRGEIAASTDPGKSAERVAGVLLANNYPKSAEQFFEQALQTTDLNGWFRLVEPYAEALGRVGNYDGLRDLIRRFVDKAEGEPRALEVAAGLFRKQGLILEATDEIKRLAEMRRGSARIEEALGVHAFSSGDSTVGLEAFKRAARLWGGAPQHIARLGEILEGQAMFEEALSLYNDAKKVHEAHPLLEVRRAVVYLGQGEIESAREALFSAIQTASEPEAILNFLSPHIRASARIDILSDGVNLALEKFPRKAGLLTMSVDTQLLLGDVGGALARAESLLQIHPDQGTRLGEIFESHQLDGIAHDFYWRELRRADGQEKKDPKNRLHSGLLRTGNWVDTGRLKELNDRYSDDYGHTSKSLGQFIQMAASHGEFELALEASQARREIDGSLLGVLQTVLLGAQLGNKVLVSETLDLAIHAARSAEDAALLVESLENLQLAGWEDEVARAYERLVSEKVELHPWIGRPAVAHALWSKGPDAGIKRLETILGGTGFLPLEELASIQSWFTWAGSQQEFLRTIEAAMDNGFRARLAVMLLRSNHSSEKAMQLFNERVGSWDESAQLMLAGALLDAGDFSAANTLLSTLLERPSSKEWRRALKLRMRSAALSGEKLSWEKAEKWASTYNENQREAFSEVRVIAREMQRWDLEEKALDRLIELTPTRTVLWLHKMEIALFQGDIKGYKLALTELLKYSSNGFEVRRELVDALEGQFEYQLALDLLAELIQTYPGDQSLVWRAGRLSLELGGLEDAERHFRAYESGHWSSRFAGYDVDKAYLDARQIRAEDIRERAPITLDDDSIEEQGWLGKSGALLQVRRRILEGNDEAGLREFTAQSTELRGKTSLLETGIALREEHPKLESTFFVKALQDAVLSGVQPSLQTDALLASELLRSGQKTAGVEKVREVLATGTRSRAVLGVLADGALASGEWALTKDICAQVLDSPLDRKLAVVSCVEKVSDHIQLRVARNEDIPEELSNLAFDYLKPLATLHPAHIWYVTLGSDVAEAKGDLQQAEKVFKMTMEAYPRDSSSFNNLAYLLARRGTDLDRAQVLVEKAMLLEPKHNVYYLDTAGWIAFKKGELERARDLLLASLRQMNRNQGQSVSESLWHLGRVYEELGSTDSAIWCYRKALRIAPSGAFGVRSEQALERLGRTGSTRSLELE